MPCSNTVNLLAVVVVLLLLAVLVIVVIIVVVVVVIVIVPIPLLTTVAMAAHCLLCAGGFLFSVDNAGATTSFTEDQ